MELLQPFWALHVETPGSVHHSAGGPMSAIQVLAQPIRFWRGPAACPADGHLLPGPSRGGDGALVSHLIGHLGAPRDSTPFLSKAEGYSVVWLDHSLFARVSPPGASWGCLHPGAAVKTAALDTLVQDVGALAFIFLMLLNGTAGSDGDSAPHFLGRWQLHPHCPQQVHRGPALPTFLPTRTIPLVLPRLWPP